MMMGTGITMTDVTIRGIDDEVYKRFSAEARNRGVPIGELVTLVMRALVEEADKDCYKIGNIEKVSVSREDLESLGGPVSFHDIDSLVFEDDVTISIFQKYVLEIRYVEKLTIPKALSKLMVFTKCYKVDDVVMS